MPDTLADSSVSRRERRASGCSCRARTASPGFTTTRAPTTLWAASSATVRESGATRRRSCTFGSAATPNAQVWINQPGELVQGEFGPPSYWGGCATLPRVHQYRDLAILVFEGHEGQPPFPPWFPTFAFDIWRVEGPSP